MKVLQDREGREKEGEREEIAKKREGKAVVSKTVRMDFSFWCERISNSKHEGTAEKGAKKHEKEK